jgi:hypothetical protein
LSAFLTVADVPHGGVAFWVFTARILPQNE